jgi:hypothetical protein
MILVDNLPGCRNGAFNGDRHNSFLFGRVSDFFGLKSINLNLFVCDRDRGSPPVNKTNDR